MDCHNYLKNYDKHYTLAEWQYNTELEINAAEKLQELADKLALEADRLIDQADIAVVKNKREIDHESKVKVRDIDFKCCEIEIKTDDLNEEINLLLGYQKRIENANKSLVGDALFVIAECFRLRNSRISVDLVFDDIEKELLKERELILSTHEQLEELFDKVVLQIRNLRSFAFTLDSDFNYKKNTLNLEAINVKLSENSVEVMVLDNKNVLKPATFSIVEWDQFTANALAASSKALMAGRPIRMYFDKVLSKIIENLVDQSKVVDREFSSRIVEYKEVIDELNKQQLVTNAKILGVEEKIDKIKTAINEKQKYIALVHTRLLNRTRRQDIELCRDQLELKLYNEMNELENNVNELRKMADESNVCLRRLKQTAVRIRIQLDMKLNTLYIDEVMCGEQRKRINYVSF